MNKRSFFWSRVFLIGLVASCAALTVAGIAATYVELPAEFAGLERSLDAICAIAFAGIAGFALGVSQMAAAMAVTLSGESHRKGLFCAFNLAVACSLVCGFISLGGIHLGAERLGLDPLWLDIAGAALCLVKPTMSFITEAARQESEAQAAALTATTDAMFYADRADSRQLERDRLTKPEASALPAPEPKPAPVSTRRPAKRKKPSIARRAVAGVLMATAGAGGVAHAEPAPGAGATEPTPISGVERSGNPRPSFDDVDRARGELERRGQNVTQDTLAAHIGCSRASVRRALGLIK